MNLRPYRNATPVLGARVYVDPSAVVIGRVTLADDVSIWPTAVLRGDVNFIEVGARSNVQDGTVVHVVHDGPTPGGIPTRIGSDVTVGHRVVLHACTVGNFCLVGMGAQILDGAVLEDFVFVGAGAVVTPGKRLTSGALYLGSPAKRARELTAAEIEGLKYSANHYVHLKDEYLEQLTSL